MASILDTVLKSTSIDALFQQNLPLYLTGMREAATQVQKVLDSCATKCILPSDDDFVKIKLVFTEAVKNIHARAIVQELDLAARALITPNPKGKTQAANQPQPCIRPGSASDKPNDICVPSASVSDGGGQLMVATPGVICCDQLQDRLVTTIDGQAYSGIAMYVAGVMYNSNYIIGWDNPQTTNLLTAFKWALLGRSQNKNTYALQMALLHLMGKAPVPVSWKTPIISALTDAKNVLAEQNLTLAQRQSFSNVSTQIIVQLTSQMAQSGSASASAGSSLVPGASSNLPAPPQQPSSPPPKPQDWLTTNWKPVSAVAGSGLVALLLIYFSHKVQH